MKIPNDVISILNRDSALTMRIYPMFEAILEENKHDIEYFINKSPIIIHSWSLRRYAEDPDHLSPLFAIKRDINEIL